MKSCEIIGQAEVKKVPGMALIKPHYLAAHVEERTVDFNFISDQDKAKFVHNEEEAENENISEDNRKRKNMKLRGQNKKRKFFKEKSQPSKNLKPCLRFVASLGNEFSEKCNLGDQCIHSHSLKDFLETRPKDIGDTCSVFDKYGYCPFGVLCRFGMSHVDNSDGQSNLIDCQKWSHWKELYHNQTKNHLDKEVQRRLRKKTFDFSKSLDALKGTVCHF